MGAGERGPGTGGGGETLGGVAPECASSDGRIELVHVRRVASQVIQAVDYRSTESSVALLWWFRPGACAAVAEFSGDQENGGAAVCVGAAVWCACVTYRQEAANVRACVREQPIFAIGRKRSLVVDVAPWFMALSGVSCDFFFSVALAC